jgi:hypothetical protein
MFTVAIGSKLPFRRMNSALRASENSVTVFPEREGLLWNAPQIFMDVEVWPRKGPTQAHPTKSLAEHTQRTGWRQSLEDLKPNIGNDVN